MSQTDDFLMHHGVKGMKWGVRRARKKEFNRRYKEQRRKEIDAGRKRIDAYKRTLETKEGRAKRREQWKKASMKERREMERDYARNQSNDNKAAKIALTHSPGYNRLRAAGHGRIAALAVSHIAPCYSAFAQVESIRQIHVERSEMRRQRREYVNNG